MMKYCCFCQYRLTHKEFETYYEQMKAIWSLYKLHGEIQCYRGNERVDECYVTHRTHGRGLVSPDNSDCPCRNTVLEHECSGEGCGFCLASEFTKEGGKDDSNKKVVAARTRRENGVWCCFCRWQILWLQKPGEAERRIRETVVIGAGQRCAWQYQQSVKRWSQGQFTEEEQKWLKEREEKSSGKR